VGDDGL
jgi:arylsulfatase A-like enzyme